MNLVLTQKQEKMYPAIRWLIVDGPRAQGKSTLMALAFLERAFNCMGSWVQVYDHFHTFEAGRHTLKIIHSLFNPQKHTISYGIQLKSQTNEFRVFPVDKDGKEIKKKEWNRLGIS